MLRSVNIPGAKWVPTRVQSYTGYSGKQEPRTFDVGNDRIEVLEFLDKWETEEHQYFKVRTKAGKFYVLRYVTGSVDWEVTTFHL